MSLQDTKVCVNTCKLHANASNRIICGNPVMRFSMLCNLKCKKRSGMKFDHIYPFVEQIRYDTNMEQKYISYYTKFQNFLPFIGSLNYAIH